MKFPNQIEAGPLNVIMLKQFHTHKALKYCLNGTTYKEPCVIQSECSNQAQLVHDHAMDPTRYQPACIYGKQEH